MADAQSPSTLREMRDHLSAYRTLVVLLLIGCVLTIVAPFGTSRTLSPVPLAVFWIFIVFVTYTTGLAIDTTMQRRLRHLSLPVRLASIAVTTGVAIAVVVDAVTGLVFGWPDTLGEASQNALRNFFLGTFVSLGVQVATRPEASATSLTTPDVPPLLDRLPFGKRGALVALSAEDHYVRVRTTKGEELVLMRLSDAIREAAPTAGLRVHRSHWVALDGIASANRKGDRTVLSLTHGDDIPASRSYGPALRDAGILPR